MTEKDLQELLKPRYLAISPNECHYPGSFWQVGDIIYATGKQTQFENFPHLFERLEWYSLRRAEQMPDYIKSGNNVGKVIEHFKDGSEEFCIAEFGAENEKRVYTCYYINFLPATEAEYLTYKQSQK
jgi:hypothetical protein